MNKLTRKNEVQEGKEAAPKSECRGCLIWLVRVIVSWGNLITELTYFYKYDKYDKYGANRSNSI